MTRLSTVDQLPEPIRAEIGRLRTQGCTIDQIVAHLRTLYGSTPSRSALGRHIQGLDKLGEKMRRSRDVAAALVRELGDAPESTAARLNIELIHSAALDGNPEGVMMLAKALDHLSRASKTNVDFVAAAEKRAAERTKKEAAVAVETVAKARGISGDTLEAIKAGIFGVRAA